MRMRRKPWTEPLLDNCPYLINSARDRRGSWRSLLKKAPTQALLDADAAESVRYLRFAFGE